MKVLTVLGTRPEIIRLSRVIEKLDMLCEHTLVHTGQNYDRNLNEIFFEELGVRQPDCYLNARGRLGEQVGTILSGVPKFSDCLFSLRPVAWRSLELRGMGIFPRRLSRTGTPGFGAGDRTPVVAL